jgi:hypothetical protein
MPVSYSDWFYALPPLFMIFVSYRTTVGWPTFLKVLYTSAAFGFGVLASLGGYIHTGRYALLAFLGAACCALICTVIYLKQTPRPT